MKLSVIFIAVFKAFRLKKSGSAEPHSKAPRAWPLDNVQLRYKNKGARHDRSHRYSLLKLVDRITEDTRPEPVDWGDPVGKEEW